MPLLPAAVLGSGRSVAPLGPGRLGVALPLGGRPREQEMAGDQTCRHVSETPWSAGSPSPAVGELPCALLALRTPSRSGDAAGPRATPCAFAGVHRVSLFRPAAQGGRRGSICSSASVHEITPRSEAAPSEPRSEGEGSDASSPTGASSPADTASPFFGGCLRGRGGAEGSCSDDSEDFDCAAPLRTSTRQSPCLLDGGLEDACCATARDPRARPVT